MNAILMIFEFVQKLYYSCLGQGHSWGRGAGVLCVRGTVWGINNKVSIKIRIHTILIADPLCMVEESRAVIELYLQMGREDR